MADGEMSERKSVAASNPTKLLRIPAYATSGDEFELSGTLAEIEIPRVCKSIVVAVVPGAEFVPQLDVNRIRRKVDAAVAPERVDTGQMETSG